MKFVLLLVSITIISCNETKTVAPKIAATKEKIHFPIAPKQTTEFEIGNPAFTKMILEIVRAYDRGDITHLKESFASQFTVMLQEQYLQGQRDTVLQQLQEKRARYTFVDTVVESWVSLHATDTNENFVLVWGKRLLTQPDKKVLHRTIMEKWRINGQGQVDFMQQYINESFDTSE